MSKILVLPDLHAPHTDLDLLEKVAHFNNTIYKADTIVQLGDLFDFYSLSNYIKSTKADNGAREVTAATKQIKAIAKLFPKMTVLMGNHEARLAKRASEAGIDSRFLRNIMDVVEAPKTWKYYDEEDYIEIDGVIYTHGFLSNPRAHAEYFNAPVVMGHLHAHMGINYIARKNSCIYSMCPGFIADIDSLVFQYGPLKKYNKFCLGFGTVSDGVPQIYPLMGKTRFKHGLTSKDLKRIVF